MSTNRIGRKWNIPRCNMLDVCITMRDDRTNALGRQIRLEVAMSDKGARRVNRYIRCTHIVLSLLCVMYFITYIDRINVATAAANIQKDLHFSNTQLGLIFSGFAYPYLIFQVFGGWIGDRFGAHKTLFWCAIAWAAATILTGFVISFTTLFFARLLLGFGEGATFPTATRAMQFWTSAERRGFAQGLTHASSRLGNAITPPLIAVLIFYTTWRGSFILVGIASLIWAFAWVYYFRDEPEEHPAITHEELSKLPKKTTLLMPPVPWPSLLSRMWPVTLTYFCYAWCLWLYLNWLPLFFKTNFHLNLGKSAIFASGVFFAGVVGDTLGGLVSDSILKRTGRLRFARLFVIIVGFVGAFFSLLPIYFSRDLTIVAVSLSAGFFFAELVIGPMWSIPMDITPKYSGTAAGLMNIGSASAAIVSPVAAGYVIDLTHNWYLPFFITMGLMIVGVVSASMMYPDRPLEEGEPSLAPNPSTAVAVK